MKNNLSETIDKIEFILQRNGMYAQYDDSEDGSFSEGEKVLALTDQALADQKKRILEEVIGEDEPEWESGMGIAGQDLDRECRNKLRQEMREKLEKICQTKPKRKGWN